MLLARIYRFKKIQNLLKQIEEKWKPVLDSNFERTKNRQVKQRECCLSNEDVEKRNFQQLFIKTDIICSNIFSAKGANMEEPHARDVTPPRKLLRFKEELDAGLWRPIYRFPYVKHARVLCRLKLFQTVLTVAVCGGSSVLHLLGNLSLSDLSQFCGVSIFALATVTIVGNFSRKLIGAVYVSDDMKKVRLARLTFYGNREDFVVPAESIVDLLSTNKLSNLYFTLRFTEPEDATEDVELYHEHFNFYLKLGGVLDKERFAKIFGRIMDHLPKRERIKQNKN